MEKPLAHIARIFGGYPFRTALRQADAGPVLVIQPKDVGEVGGRRLWTGSLFMFAPDGAMDDYLVRQGDVLFLARATKDHAILVGEIPDDRVVIASGQFFVLRPGAGVLAAYLAWYLNQAPTQAYLREIGGRSTIPYIRRIHLMTVPVDVPPLDVQQRIVQVAECWEREKELVRRHMEKREQLIANVSWAAAQAQARDGEKNVAYVDSTAD